MATIAEEISSLIEQLPPSDQRRVFEFTRELLQAHRPASTPLPIGTPGSVAARLRVTTPEAGEAMERALEECERIDLVE